MNTPIERIKVLIDSLPKKDIPLGYKFLSERNFESLKELVDSAIYKIEKNLKTDNPKEEYLKINLDNLDVLKAEVDLYLAMLDPYEDMYNIKYKIDEECY